MQKFGAYLAGGLASADMQTVHSLALLFDRIYIPFNPGIMRSVIADAVTSLSDVKAIWSPLFSADLEHGRFEMTSAWPISISGNVGEYIDKSIVAAELETDPDLQRRIMIMTAMIMRFYGRTLQYLPLFDDVVYADLFADGKPYDLEQLAHATWRCTPKRTIELPPPPAQANISELMARNYFPVVTPPKDLAHIDSSLSTRSLAALLAIKSHHIAFATGRRP